MDCRKKIFFIFDEKNLTHDFEEFKIKLGVDNIGVLPDGDDKIYSNNWKNTLSQDSINYLIKFFNVEFDLFNECIRLKKCINNFLYI